MNQLPYALGVQAQQNGGILDILILEKDKLPSHFTSANRIVTIFALHVRTQVLVHDLGL